MNFTDGYHPGPVENQVRQALLYTQLFGSTPAPAGGFMLRLQEVPYIPHRTFEGSLGEEFALAGDRPGRLPKLFSSRVVPALGLQLDPFGFPELRKRRAELDRERLARFSSAAPSVPFFIDESWLFTKPGTPRPSVDFTPPWRSCVRAEAIGDHR